MHGRISHDLHPRGSVRSSRGLPEVSRDRRRSAAVPLLQNSLDRDAARARCDTRIGTHLPRKHGPTQRIHRAPRVRCEHRAARRPAVRHHPTAERRDPRVERNDRALQHREIAIRRRRRDQESSAEGAIERGWHLVPRPKRHLQHRALRLAHGNARRPHDLRLDRRIRPAPSRGSPHRPVARRSLGRFSRDRTDVRRASTGS